ncbi:MAG: PTS glucose transporter subunit IIA [Angelakisella sp.]
MLEKLKGLFGLSKADNTAVILAPVAGESVPLQEVPDPTFSQELLGKGVAILPTSGRIVAPVDGKVLGIFRTSHAVTLGAENGAEILIHIGIDTVKLAGQHFTPHVVKGDLVKAGDLLIEADLEAIQAAGYNTIVPVLVCNTDEFNDVAGSFGTMAELDTLITLQKK